MWSCDIYKVIKKNTLFLVIQCGLIVGTSEISTSKIYTNQGHGAIQINIGDCFVLKLYFENMN